MSLECELPIPTPIQARIGYATHRKRHILRKLLGLGSLCLLGLGLSAQAHAQAFNFSVATPGAVTDATATPSGSSHIYYTGASSFHVTASGYISNQAPPPATAALNRTQMYGKTGSNHVETGLGLNNNTSDHEIGKRQYIAIDASSIGINGSMQLWVGSIQLGEDMAIYGVNSLSSFGLSGDSDAAKEMAWVTSIDNGNTSSRLFNQLTAGAGGTALNFPTQEAAFNYNLSDYQYFVVTATQADVILEDQTNYSISKRGGGGPGGLVTPEGSSLLLLLPGFIPVAVGLRRRKLAESVQA